MANLQQVGLAGGVLCTAVGGYVLYNDWSTSNDPMRKVPKDLKDKARWDIVESGELF